MKFLRLDKTKGSGAPSISSRYAYLIAVSDIDYLPPLHEKGVRLEGDIVLKEDCVMMPLYLTNSSQEFSYDVLGDDDEKTYKTKFVGTHPGTELEALEFAKNQIEQPYLVLIPSCKTDEPWKLLGEITNPLIFTSTHKSSKDGSKFTFSFEQRIGSEYIYFSYGGIVEPPEVPGPYVPPSGSFDPTKWARIDASNIDAHIAAWRTKLGIGSSDSYQIGPITTTSNSVTIGLHPSGENYAIINGAKYIEPIPIVAKLVTPVSAGKLKQVIIHALPDASVFHIAEGIEGEQATTPDFTGLFVASIIFSDSGQIIDNGFLKSEIKYTEEDGWRNITLTEALTVLPYTFDLRSSYWIESQIGSPTIGGIRNSLIDRNTSPSWDGKEFWIYNNTGSDLPLNSAAVTEEDVFLFTSQITLKDKQSCKVKIRRDVLEIVGVLSGEEFDPTYLQNQIDAEIVNRALADTNLENTKLNKPSSPNNVNTKVILGDGSTKDLSEITVSQITITTAVSITTNTLPTINSRSQLGRNVIISNGVNAINLSCETSSDANFVASYTKLGSASITFTAGSGATLIQVDGTAILNGAVGSTACLTRSGNAYYLQISNR
ncbi:hypothetical protein [Chryseobacterium sp. MP_3.2]|uniref:hypothetical protein n=1 Tax=Chryseobacterium sp. MP_3.2 TaxID=3071712 RepID=UPI002E092871|nr:hypothetical protein [Chryseobacterium sp. MP_3.2]